MPNILPVSDLRNYNEVLKNCHKGEPVYLTKNGRGRFVVMDIEDYERDRAEKKLLMKLQEAEEAVHDGEGWIISLKIMKNMLRRRFGRFMENLRIFRCFREWVQIFPNESAFGQIINMLYGRIM